MNTFEDSLSGAPRSAGHETIRTRNDHARPDVAETRAQTRSLVLGWHGSDPTPWSTSDDRRELVVQSRSLIEHGSGLMLIDADPGLGLSDEIRRLARVLRRGEDVRVLDLTHPVAGTKITTFNPFATADADTVRDLLRSQIREDGYGQSSSVFRARAICLADALASALVWLRDNKDVALDIDVVRRAVALDWIWMLATHKVCILRDSDTERESEVDVAGVIPDDVIRPLADYLSDLPGYDPTVPLSEQKSGEPSRQHGYVIFYFSKMFTQLAVSLGHVFRCGAGDIDMQDIVRNRRILIVTLPALENSDATLAALVGLFVASLRGTFPPDKRHRDRLG